MSHETDRQESKRSEKSIYQSLWKNILLAILCLTFAAVGCLIIRDDDCSLITKVLGGWLNVVCFGGSGLFIIIVTLYNRIRHIPLLIIHEDKLELYVRCKGTYHTVHFADVERFRLTKVHSAQMIAIDYKIVPLMQKFEKSSYFMQKIMGFNIHVNGAIESIPVDFLSMKGKEIYDLLNEYLRKTHSTLS